MRLFEGTEYWVDPLCPSSRMTQVLLINLKHFVHQKSFFYASLKELVYDQDNLIVVTEDGGDLILTKEFQQYRETRKLNLRVCRKADPESKGKIENVVQRRFLNVSIDSRS